MKNHDPPLISIIMAARNTAAYLPRCLDSVLAQTYPNWELIAVNDRSTDDTRKILDKYADRDARIRVFDSDGERLNPALKYGQNQMRGMLVNRMDSDDYMPSYKLQSLYDVWVSGGRGTIAAGGTQHFVDEGEVGGGFLRYDAWLNKLAREGTHYEEIYKECVIPSHCWLLHRDDFLAVDGFNPDVYPEDYDLCFRFYRVGFKVSPLNRVVHYWRDRSDRISRTWDEYKDNRYFDLKLKYFYELDRDFKRPLVLWGAGPNGKDLVKKLKPNEQSLHWVCDSPGKIGQDIYGIILEPEAAVEHLTNPQIIIAVANPVGQQDIRERLHDWGKSVRADYWFFL